MKRLMWSLFSILLASLLIFVAVDVLPGDTTYSLLHQQASEEQRETLREELGLDAPATVRYMHWLADIGTGNLGKSYRTGQPVAPTLQRRLTNSLLLAIPAMIVGTALAVTLGIVSGLCRGSFFDKTVSIIALFGLSIPESSMAIFLITVFSIILGWFPATSTAVGAVEPKQLVLPMTVLVVIMQAHILRLTRDSVTTTLQQPYITVAQAKGLPSWLLVGRHVLKHALIPVIGVVVLDIGWMLGSAVIVEIVFAYPGMGRLVLDAINARDVPVIQATMLAISMIYLTASFLTDIALMILDPRVEVNQ